MIYFINGIKFKSNYFLKHEKKKRNKRAIRVKCPILKIRVNFKSEFKNPGGLRDTCKGNQDRSRIEEMHKATLMGEFKYMRGEIWSTCDA